MKTNICSLLLPLLLLVSCNQINDNSNSISSSTTTTSNFSLPNTLPSLPITIDDLYYITLTSNIYASSVTPQSKTVSGNDAKTLYSKYTNLEFILDKPTDFTSDTTLSFVIRSQDKKQENIIGIHSNSNTLLAYLSIPYEDINGKTTFYNSKTTIDLNEIGKDFDVNIKDYLRYA